MCIILDFLDSDAGDRKSDKEILHLDQLFPTEMGPFQRRMKIDLYYVKLDIISKDKLTS